MHFSVHQLCFALCFVCLCTISALVVCSLLGVVFAYPLFHRHHAIRSFLHSQKTVRAENRMVIYELAQFERNSYNSFTNRGRKNLNFLLVNTSAIAKMRNNSISVRVSVRLHNWYCVRCLHSSNSLIVILWRSRYLRTLASYPYGFVHVMLVTLHWLGIIQYECNYQNAASSWFIEIFMLIHKKQIKIRHVLHNNKYSFIAVFFIFTLLFISERHLFEIWLPFANSSVCYTKVPP